MFVGDCRGEFKKMASPSWRHLLCALVFSLIAINVAANYDDEKPPSPSHDQEDQDKPNNYRKLTFLPPGYPHRRIPPPPPPKNSVVKATTTIKISATTTTTKMSTTRKKISTATATNES
ncbi:hypothetical protein OIU77_016924 [Salix suchowensis]|uniref:Uncharacterized protein n=1 Tax=Salix suchowensis TaxID=1278906 RepID=A0ABQ8ZMF1_9ROSI|nr:hypothetical protein OIU77_016924 [Salix suchowensis]